MPKAHIIVSSRPENEGEVVLEKQLVDIRAADGIELLPVDLDLLSRSPIGGYFRRSYGEGLVLDSNLPKRFVGATLFLSQYCQMIYWKAEIVAMQDVALRIRERAGNALELEGSLTLIADTAQHTPFGHVGLKAPSPFDFRQLQRQKLEVEKSMTPYTWVIGGQAPIYVPQDGIYGLALYGRAMSFRLNWFAVTQA
jgi:hypothetical protein